MSDISKTVTKNTMKSVEVKYETTPGLSFLAPSLLTLDDLELS